MILPWRSSVRSDQRNSGCAVLRVSAPAKSGFFSNKTRVSPDGERELALLTFIRVERHGTRMCVRRWRAKAGLITGWASSTFNNGYVALERSTFNLYHHGQSPARRRGRLSTDTALRL